MPLYRCILLAVLCHVLLVNASGGNRRKPSRERFGDNYAVGFGKRSDYLHEPRIRPRFSVQKQGLDERVFDSRTPYWHAYSAPLPESNTDYWGTSPSYRYIQRTGGDYAWIDRLNAKNDRQKSTRDKKLALGLLLEKILLTEGMALYRCFALVILSHVLLVTASGGYRPTPSRRRFGDNFAIGFGKRGDDLPTSRINSALDSRKPYWYADSGSRSELNFEDSDVSPGYEHIRRNDGGYAWGDRLDAKNDRQKATKDEELALGLLLKKFLLKKDEETTYDTL